jgi:hypothetical protein
MSGLDLRDDESAENDTILRLRHAGLQGRKPRSIFGRFHHIRKRGGVLERRLVAERNTAGLQAAVVAVAVAVAVAV